MKEYWETTKKQLAIQYEKLESKSVCNTVHILFVNYDKSFFFSLLPAVVNPAFEVKCVFPLSTTQIINVD